MKEFLSQLHFAGPSFLLLLGLLPLFWLRWRERSLAVILWRSVIFSLLVFTLAGPEKVGEITRMEEKATRIFAFDLSRSVPSSMSRWMERVAKEDLFPAQGDRLFVFGGETREVKDWEGWLRGEISAEPIQPGWTNLENLFSVLLRLPAPPRTVYLFTDGWETKGGVESLLSSLAGSSLKIFPFLPSSRLEVTNVTVKRVLAPHRGESGEGIKLRVAVENHSSREIQGRIILQRNGQPFKTDAVKVKPGSQLFTYKTTLPDKALTSFQAIFVPKNAQADHFFHDNKATAWVAIRSKEKVLVLNEQGDQGRYLVEILRRRGFQVTSVDLDSPPPNPKGYKAVVFNNVARERFSPAYLAAMERYVSGGGSFMMLGGEESFGPGGYLSTPIEDLLPLKLKEPKEEKEERNRAVVLVIDKSGSMRRQKKLLYAKEAAKALAESLSDRDLLGVVGFDISPFVVVPLSLVERLRETFASQIDRLKARGKTYLFPAIIEAKRQLERKEASRKHVIILSDGETGGSGSDYIDLINFMRKELKITVSAVAIGDQANIPLLRRIARYGGGLFHHTFDPTTLPQIVLQEIRDEPQEEPLVEKDLIPVLVSGSRLLKQFPEGSFPAVRGFVETEIKEGAGLDVIVPSGGKRLPLLASWIYGNGKAVAFTTDLHGRWTKAWIRWEGLGKFWRRVFDWLIPPQDPFPPHEVRINILGDRPVLDLYLYQEKDDASLFRYSFKGKAGKGKGVLNRVAPGHYRTTLPFAVPGDYRIELIESGAGKDLSYPLLGYTLPFDPRAEVPQDSFNTALLERLARATGGEINSKGDEELKAPAVIRTSRSLRSTLILPAMILFLLEILFRRFVLRLVR
ncbi:MAG: VWA domain-containing protein [Deltaproteobacteria bacterium]|nr:VWA domain-containing protein [Deltaproteobacteria bacterium]